MRNSAKIDSRIRELDISIEALRVQHREIFYRWQDLDRKRRALELKIRRAKDLRDQLAQGQMEFPLPAGPSGPTS